VLGVDGAGVCGGEADMTKERIAELRQVGKFETKLGLNECLDDIEKLQNALLRAIEIIKLHVPDDALGINSNCGEPVAQTWPIKDEEIYYMEEALK
jgi:hypothetical protein